VRTFEREYRDRGRVIREYREPDGVISREFRDEQNRTVREYRDPAGRVVREYVPVPSAGLAPSGGGPVTSYSTGEVDASVSPGAPGAAYTAPGYAGAGGDSVLVTKDGRVTRVGGAAPRASRSPAFEARVAARLDSLERTVAARDAAEGRTTTAGLSDEQIRAIVREELARDAIVRDERGRAAAGVAAVTPTTEVRTRETVRTVGPRPYDPRLDARGVQGGMLYSGATVSSGGQLLFGGRLDFGRIAPSVPGFRLVPEVAVGAGGGGTSTYVAANAQYEVGPIFRVRPRVGVGAGLLNFSSPVAGRDGLEAVVTPSYGASLPIGTFRTFGRAPELVVEHQGINFFKLNRLLVGVGWRR
jgi:hypothetical protein